MARRRQRNVYGEPVEVLHGALALLLASARRTDDGGYAFHGVLAPAHGCALVRALWRAEAALLRRDADALRDEQNEALPDHNRRVQAFVALVQRVAVESRQLGLPPLGMGEPAA